MAKGTRHELAPSVINTTLPGPTRKRAPSGYCYRLTYCNPDPSGVGCALLWEVAGGRDTYQVALERQESGELRWHCSCADAIYRGEKRKYACKHVKALQNLGRVEQEAAAG